MPETEPNIGLQLEYTCYSVRSGKTMAEVP